MSNTNVSNNDMVRTRGPGLHKATVHKECSTQDNICVITCYYQTQDIDRDCMLFGQKKGCFN